MSAQFSFGVKVVVGLDVVSFNVEGGRSAPGSVMFNVEGGRPAPGAVMYVGSIQLSA